MTKDGFRVGGCGRGNHYNRCGGDLYVSKFLPHNQKADSSSQVDYTKWEWNGKPRFSTQQILEFTTNQELPRRMRSVQICFERIEIVKTALKKEKPITKGEQKIIDIWVNECEEEENEIGRLLFNQQPPKPKKMIVIKLSTEQSTNRKHRIEDDEPLSEVLMRIQIEREAAMV